MSGVCLNQDAPGIFQKTRIKLLSQSRIKTKMLGRRTLCCLGLVLLTWSRPSHAVLYRITEATTDYLDEIAELEKVTSPIHCGHACFLATNEDDCASFAFDKVSKTCKCGRRMTFAMRSNASQQAPLLHSNVLCKKSSPPGIDNYLNVI